ncbi:MAG: glycosyltransferase family 2 protein [Nitrospiraceae bacterium]
MTAPARASLVIAVWNQLDYTKRCLSSIVQWTDPPYEVVVVDNGSTDGTREFLRTVKATVITNDTNLGCAKAWNQGVRASQAAVVGILNNDIVVTPGWLEGLLSFMENTGHGMVCPAAREGKLDYDLDSYAQEFVRRCGRAARSGDMYAACMLIRRDVFERVGLFDEAFLYGGCEDIDFLWRMKQAGFSVGMTGSVLIHHFGMVTQDAVKSNETKAHVKGNLAHFQSKWNRTVRGNWFNRRWDDLRASWRRRYERLRYGHTLVEKPTGNGSVAR